MFSFISFVARFLMGGFEALYVENGSVIVGKHNAETQSIMEV